MDQFLRCVVFVVAQQHVRCMPTTIIGVGLFLFANTTSSNWSLTMQGYHID